MKDDGKSFVSGLLKPVFRVLFLMYLAYLTCLTFFSHFYGREKVHRSINWVPFRTILKYLTEASSSGVVLTNLAGNILAFVPMGFLLPLVSRKFSGFGNTFAAVLAGTAVIETMQYVAGAGVSDVDDVILNLAGGVLGYGLYKGLTGWRKMK